MANLAELFALMDQSSVKVQVLGECLDGKQTVRKDGAVMLRFATMAADLSDILSGKRNALIVWADTEAFEAARQKLIAAPVSEPEDRPA